MMVAPSRHHPIIKSADAAKAHENGRLRTCLGQGLGEADETARDDLMTRAEPFEPIRGPLLEARFVERPNRFLVIAEPVGGGGPHEAHLPDPGRLRELLVPGRSIWLQSAASAARRTKWSAVLVQAPQGDGLISLDTTLPNRLIGRALSVDAISELRGWKLDRSEVTMGRSRFDFLLSREDGRQLVLEVKSVTLVEEGVALFPDAVTERGARHVRELGELAGKDGWEAAVLFVLQRADARSISAAREIDPRFSDALAQARKAGVRVLGRRCRVTLDGVSLGEPVPVT